MSRPERRPTDARADGAAAGGAGADGDAGPDVDVLIPTYHRPEALALALGSLVGQTHERFRVVVADQSEEVRVGHVPAIRAAARVLRLQGRPVEIVRNLPRRGLAQQRQFLFERAAAPYCLFLDDDVVLEPDLLERLVRAIRRAGCGFVGSFVNAPSAVRSRKPEDEPPPDVALELWDGPVRPERVVPGSPAWERSRLHFAAYPWRLAERLGIGKDRERLYKVAWVGGCVLFDRAALRDAGAFRFWEALPREHAGEDVVAQLRVMERCGGAGLVPSGAWHQEVPTTTPAPARSVDAPVELLARPEP